MNAPAPVAVRPVLLPLAKRGGRRIADFLRINRAAWQQRLDLAVYGDVSDLLSAIRCAPGEFAEVRAFLARHIRFRSALP